MRQILDYTNNYILVINKNSKIKFCNKGLLKKIEFSENEITTININEILKCDEKRLSTIIEDVKNGNEVNCDLNLFNKSKEIIPVNCNITINDFEDEECIFFVGKDISEKLYSREDLEILLDNLPLSIWIKNADGKYLYANEHYAERFNLNRRNILNKYDIDLWDEKRAQFYKTVDDEIIASKMPKVFDEVVENENEKTIYEIYKAPIFDKNDNIKYTIGTTENVTVDKRISEKIITNSPRVKGFEGILNNNHSINESQKLLNQVGEELFKYVEAENLIILMYNKEAGCLEKKVELGKTIEISDEEIFKITHSDIEYLENNTDHEGIKYLSEVDNPKIKKWMIHNNVNYIGNYNIMYNKKIIGLVSIRYFDKNKIKIIRDDYIKSVCNHIGLYIKNLSLSNDVLKEFEKRKNTEKELANYLEISADIVAKIDFEGNVIMANDHCKEALGYSEEDLMQLNLKHIIVPNSGKSKITQLFDTSKNYMRGVNYILVKDGSTKTFEWNYKIVEEEGYVIVTAKDITKQKEEEENKRKLEEAIKLESFKNEFFANISHEFKTPLNIIMGAVQLISKNIELDNLSEDDIYRRYIKSIRQNSYRLIRLVNNLIDITRIDTGFYEIQLGNYDIVNIIENITLSVAQYTEDKEINLIFDTNSEETTIACDPDKIERIMLNLLSNAIKYTDVDGNIFVDVNVSKDKIVVSVEDSGIGIEEDKIPSIFERFKQVDNVLTRKCEGSGIGLSLVKSLVELHGGNIEATSEVGKGTKLTFELPVRIIENDENKPMFDIRGSGIQIEKCDIEFSDIYM